MRQAHLVLVALAALRQALMLAAVVVARMAALPVMVVSARCEAATVAAQVVVLAALHRRMRSQAQTAAVAAVDLVQAPSRTALLVAMVLRCGLAPLARLLALAEVLALE